MLRTLIGTARVGLRTVGGLAGLALLAVGTVPDTANAKPEAYKLDPDHTSIGFLVMHIGYQRQLGMFLEKEGTLTFDRETGQLSDLTVTIETDSVFTGHEKRDNHLKGGDFLNAEEFPTMTFVGQRVEQTGESSGTLHGELTLLGVTRPLALDVTFNKAAEYPFGGGLFGGPNFVVGFSARATIERSQYGMTYGVDNGLVGDKVELIIEAEAIRTSKPD